MCQNMAIMGCLIFSRKLYEYTFKGYAIAVRPEGATLTGSSGFT